MKTLIGIPTNRLLQPQMVTSLINLVKKNPDVDVVLATQGYTIAENRNFLVAQAIKGGYTHLLMIDDDMIFPENTLEQLASHDKDITGVIAHSRALPLMPVVEFFDDNELSDADRLLGRRNIPTELFQCKAVGGGVVLVNMRIFKEWQEHWFDTEVYPTGMTKTGEDSWFCYEAQKRGFEVWCDPSLKIGHIGNYIY